MNGLGNKLIFAKNLQRYMDKEKIDRYQLCKDLNFKYSTVSEWLAAKKYPRIDKIEIIANYFNILKSDLIEETTANSISQPATNKKIINTLTDHENKLINAYRDKPEMQAAVDTLLGITKTDNESKERPVRTMRIAALGGGVTEHKYTATDEEIDEAIAYDEDEILD